VKAYSPGQSKKMKPRRSILTMVLVHGVFASRQRCAAFGNDEKGYMFESVWWWV
jgi:hypothetical protein